MNPKVASEAAVDLVGRAVVSLLRGNGDEAERLLRRALRLAPNWALGYAYLGTVLGARGKKGAARRLLEQAVRLDPGDFLVRLQRARYFLGDGAYREAFIELAVALWKAPDPGTRAQVRGLLRQILRVVQADLWAEEGKGRSHGDPSPHCPRR
ncbi:MAG: hypothetical protein C4315_11870 [Chloroflexota bacterium]